MNAKSLLIPLMVMTFALAACGERTEPDSHPVHDAPVSEAGSPERGPHGGRLLREAGFSLEVVIDESGPTPLFRVFPAMDGVPLPPHQVQLEMTLQRINGRPGGRLDRLRLVPRDDALWSATAVEEPHSFFVTVEARHGERQYRWRYDTPEARVEVPANMARAQGLETAEVGPGEIDQTVLLQGRIVPASGRHRSLRARFPGLVESVSVEEGTQVQAGQLLATVEANDSLQRYALRAPIAGTVVRRAVHPGEAVNDQQLFEIVDVSQVWAEFEAFPLQRAALAVGQRVRLVAHDDDPPREGRVDYIAPISDDAPTVRVRVVLDNADGHWVPGQWASARVSVARQAADRVIPRTAVQTYRDGPAVFLVEAERYQAQPVVLGAADEQWIAIQSGVEPGARIVTANSFLLKAEIEKSAASHDH